MNKILIKGNRLFFLFLLFFLVISVFAKEKEQIVYFTNGCLDCKKAEREVISKIPDSFDLIWADATSTNVLKTLLSLRKDNPVFPPAVYFREKLYNKYEIHLILLTDLLKPPLPKTKAKPEKNLDATGLFMDFSFFVILFSGFIDGINPCAMVTLLFFLSYLSSLKQHLKSILKTGLFFVLGIFLCYFFVGIFGQGVLFVFQKWGISDFFSYVILGMTGILFFLSLFDLIEAYTNKNAKEYYLKLPVSFTRKIHHIIRHFLPKEGIEKKLPFFYMSAFLSGILVSLIETVCTGQIYLPILKIVFEESKGFMRTKAFIYLLFYNVSFIIPLLLILICFIKIETTSMIQKIQAGSILFRLFFPVLFLLLFAVQIIYL